MNVVIRSRQQWDGTEVTYHRGNGVYSGSSFSTNLSEMQWTEIDFLLRQLCRGNRVGSPRELTHKRAIMTLFGFKWNKRARQQGSKASALFRTSSQAVGVNISWPFPWFCWDLWQTFQKTVNGITTYQRLIHYSQRWEWGTVRPLFFILLHTVNVVRNKWSAVAVILEGEQKSYHHLC